ncbi:MAG: hypothetical protein MUP81_04575 [Dehalococcoidia bacterium]|nr:hypothetical protein [Dehalococcoidia bacterium]
MEEEKKPPEIGYKAEPHEEMCGYTYCPNSMQISHGACVFYGWVIDDGNCDVVVTFFEGPIALGRIIATVRQLTDQAIPIKSIPGIELDHGLSVLMTADVHGVTVFWRPRTEREAT